MPELAENVMESISMRNSQNSSYESREITNREIFMPDLMEEFYLFGMWAAAIIYSFSVQISHFGNECYPAGERRLGNAFQGSNITVIDRLNVNVPAFAHMHSCASLPLSWPGPSFHGFNLSGLHLVQSITNTLPRGIC